MNIYLNQFSKSDRMIKLDSKGVSFVLFFFSSRRRHTRYWRDWSSDVCSSDLRADLELVEQLEEFQVSAASELGIDDEGVPFHVKKEVTSALRRLAPIGLSTDIVWTANARTLRHVIEMRTAPGAEEELRLGFDEIAGTMEEEAPGLFQDFARADDGSWVPEYRKV